ncbi:MAG TPA: methyltransferase domain-containing protein [Kofleriaceae bacterium]|nr:methyltransferase domain-containing protein [Kofleriaceae bacterium]
MQRILEPEVMDGEGEATAYADMDHTAVNRAFVERLRALGAAGRMLDIGTGPADIPLLVVDRWSEARVVAVDLAPAMLALAAQRRDASPHAARLELVLGDATSLPLDDGSFDAVFSNTILHHLPDPVPFLREAGRVLRPGGALLIRDLYRPASEAHVQDLVALHAATTSPAGRELFTASLRAALTPDELRAAADAAGLADAVLVIDTDRHMSLQRAAA